MAFTPITITGHYEQPDGSPAAGTVTFQLNQTLRDPATGQIIGRVAQTTPLSGGGLLSAVVEATDDPTTTPVGGTYRVTERLTDAPVREYNIAVPANSPGGVLDLASVPAATSVPMDGYVLLAVYNAHLPAHLPPGGTTGQVLAKTGGADYAVGWTTGGGGGGGHTLADEGTALPARGTLNFVGPGVTATDNPGANRTDVTIPGGGTPAAHATSHGSAGSDPLTPGAIGALAIANGLSELAGDPATARGNLGLGDSATKNVGTTAGTVAAGDDSRLLGVGLLLAEGDLLTVDSTGAFYVVPRGAEGDVLVPGARGVPLTWTPLGAALAWTATVVSVSPYTPALERVSIVNLTAYGDNVSIVLPPITTPLQGRRLTIKVINPGAYQATITGDAAQGDVIDGAGELIVTNEAVTLFATALSGGSGGAKTWLRI